MIETSRSISFGGRWSFGSKIDVKYCHELVVDTEFSDPLVEGCAWKNVSMIVIYLKGALNFLVNCLILLTDIMGILTNNMCFLECDDFSVYMWLVYFDHKERQM